MTRDYGVRSAHRGPPVLALALLIGVPVLATTVGASWVWSRQKSIAEAREWTITGPPCLAEPRGVYLSAPNPAKHVFEYDDVSFGRAFGDASCNEVVNDGGRGWGAYPVCQFTSPEVLTIKTRRGDFFFSIRSGPATISVRHDLPGCVLNANFRGQPANAADTAVGVDP